MIQEVDILPEDGLTAKERADLKQVGRKIKRIRTARKMTQEELFSQSDTQLSGKAVSRFERGDREMKLTTFFAFSEALNVTPNDISPERLLSEDAIQVTEFSDLVPDFQRLLKVFASTLRGLQQQGMIRIDILPQLPPQIS